MIRIHIAWLVAPFLLAVAFALAMPEPALTRDVDFPPFVKRLLSFYMAMATFASIVMATQLGLYLSRVTRNW